MDQHPRTENQPPDETPKPVAYDAEGRPLYAEPPKPIDGPYGQQTGPQFVHFSRAVDPIDQPISDEMKAKHDDSVKSYPTLNLSSAEYVVSDVQRHVIGMAAPVVLSILSVAVIASLLINFPLIVTALGITTPPPFGAVFLGGLIVIAAVLMGGYSKVWIYTNNKFFLTNESIIQEIQSGMLSHREQTVSLEDIEDVSYTQQGPLQMLFDYGSIKLSSEGDEANYMFDYVAHPKDQAAILTNTVEAFKDGRPIRPR
jgi:uncharacterized membrane protein YdbT with pleckstrin-like domain